MRTTPTLKTALATAACAASLGLAACTTEPDEVAEAPLDESTVVDADEPGVGVPSPQGDADPVTAVPGENAFGEGDASEGEAPSGAEPTNDITSDEKMPAASAPPAD